MRIISGQFRGKKLVSAPEEITRPTSDRGKEGLFNVLESYLLKVEKHWHELTFVDVFAGSGAIGIEACSRGVKRVFFFENNSVAMRHLKQNINAIGVKNIELLQNALYPPFTETAVDVYFSDAPYQKGLTEKALTAFNQNGWINENTLIILETDYNEKLNLPEEFVYERQLSYSRNQFYIVKKNKINKGG